MSWHQITRCASRQSSIKCGVSSQRNLCHFLAHSAYFNILRQKVPYSNVLRQKVPYFNILRQNRVVFNCFATKQCWGMLTLALSGSLWLPLARSCSLRLPIALRICVQHPRSAHKTLAQLAAALQHFLLLCLWREIMKGVQVPDYWVLAQKLSKNLNVVYYIAWMEGCLCILLHFPWQFDSIDIHLPTYFDFRSQS